VRLLAAFIVTVLIILTVWPLIIRNQISAVRDDIDRRSLKAQQDVQDVRRAFLNEISDLLYWRITHEQTYLERYSNHRRELENKFRELQNRTSALGGWVQDAYAEVAKALLVWNQQITPDTYRNQEAGSDAFDERVLRQNVLVRSVYESLDRLEAFLDRRIAEQRAKIFALERKQTIGVFILSTLALFAVVVIVVIARRLIRALRESEMRREEAQKATAARDEVLRIVSHDLRNPINIVSLASYQLADQHLPEDRRGHLIALIRRSMGRMNSLIQTLLDVGKAQSGRSLLLNPSKYDLRAILNEACSFSQLDVARKSLQLSCEVEGRVATVYADREKILQVLSNLIGNAIKFTPEKGRITVRAHRDGDEVCISVSDSGPGIAEQDQARIFDPYWQAQKTAHLGTGLGLAIVQRIVEDHGGRVWVQSQVGLGSTFFFTLPAENHIDVERAS
jgi:signal transduction histidine kinase